MQPAVVHRHKVGVIVPNVAGVGNILDVEPEAGGQLGEARHIRRGFQIFGELALKIVVRRHQVEHRFGRPGGGARPRERFGLGKMAGRGRQRRLPLLPGQRPDGAGKALYRKVAHRRPRQHRGQIVVVQVNRLPESAPGEKLPHLAGDEVKMPRQVRFRPDARGVVANYLAAGVGRRQAVGALNQHLISEGVQAQIPKGFVILRFQRERQVVNLNPVNVQIGNCRAGVSFALVNRADVGDGNVHRRLAGIVRLDSNDDNGNINIPARQGNAFHPFQVGHELHKLVRADNVHPFLIAPFRAGLAGEHQPQAPPDGLLRQNVGVGSVRAQTQHHGNIADIPALAQHHHADHSVDRAVLGVNTLDHIPRPLQIAVGDFAVPANMYHLQPVAAEVIGVGGLQVGAHRVGIGGAFQHCEQHRLFAQRRQLLAVLPPAVDRRRDVGAIAHRRLIRRHLAGARQLPPDRLLHYAVPDGIPQRVIVNHPRKQGAIVETGRGRKIHLRHKVGGAHPLAQTPYRLVPRRALLVRMVRLIIDDQHRGAAPRNPVVKIIPLGGGIAGRRPQNGGNGPRHTGRPPPPAGRRRRIVKLLNVSQIHRAGGGHIGPVAPHIKAHPAPLVGVLRRHHRIAAERGAAGKIALQPLKHNHIGRDNQKPGRVTGALRFVDRVQVTPRYRQRHHHRLAAAGGHLDAVAGKVPVLQQPRLRVRQKGLQQRAVVPRLLHFPGVNQRLHRRPLRRIEGEPPPVHRVVGVKPPAQQPTGSVRGARVVGGAPFPHRMGDSRGAGGNRRLRCDGVIQQGHTETSSRRVVSLPRMSITLTTIVRAPRPS